MERFFFLDDADRELIEGKRRSHNRLGFAAQLTTARYLGVFLDDPTDVPAEVVDYLAEQLGIADASALKAYGERENTRLAHVRELRKLLEYTEFAEAEAELRVWVDARAWTTGEGPKALFDAAVGWLRERRVLLPGVTTLARLVASVREAANQRLWDSLYGLLSTGQRAVLDSLLTVPPGARVSELDRLRRGPVRISGPQMKWALERAAEIDAFGMSELDVSGIPPRRLAELSRYGVDGKASLLRRHGDSRRLATLLATAVYLTSRTVDDALDLLEVLISTRLLARAERETAKQKLKTLPRMERAGIRLATAFRVVFDTTSEQVDTESGEISPPEVATLTAMGADRGGGAARGAGRRDRRVVRAGAADRLGRGRGMADDAGHPVPHRAAVPGAPCPGRRLRGHPGGAAGPEGAEVAARSDGAQEGRTRRDRHVAAGGLVAAAGAERAAPGDGHGGLEGVRVLRAGVLPPAAAPAGGVREELLEVGRPAGEAAGRRGVGAGPPDRAGFPEPARRGRGAPGGAGRAAGRHVPGGRRAGAGELPDRVRRRRPPALRRPGAGARTRLAPGLAEGGGGDDAPRRPAGGAAGGVLVDRCRPGVHLDHRR